MGILIGLHNQRGAENEKGWSVDMRDGAIPGNAVDLAALSLRPWSSRVDACPGTLPQHADPALGREDLPAPR